MKKISKVFISLSAVVMLNTYVTPLFIDTSIPTVEAATTRRTVTEGMNTYTIYDINYYFTPSKVRSIIAEHERMNGAVGKTISYIVGTLSPPIGFMLFAKDISDIALMAPFYTAKKQGKGVRMKYEYWVSNVSHSIYKIKNKTITVQ